jgi:integrase
MPRPRKPARLYLRKRVGREPRWVIRDGDDEIDTRCTERQRSEADIILGNYLRLRGAAEAQAGEQGRVRLSALLQAYSKGHGPTVADPGRITAAIKALLPFWGNLEPADINRSRCAEYARSRGRSPSTIRRELGTLNAALRWCAGEGMIPPPPPVPRPPEPPGRAEWLTRDEVARMVWRVRRRPHVVRLVLIGCYTGTRLGAMTRLRWGPHTEGGHIDIETGLLFRQSATARRTKKRQPPAPLPAPLLRLVRRWHRQDGGEGWVIDYMGDRVHRPHAVWDRAVSALGRPVTFHVLRHTAITWAMQNGAPIYEAAGFFGASPKVITDVYGHHHPDFMGGAKRAMERRR